MKKNYVVLSFIALVLLFSTGCTTNQVQKTIECGNDTKCADQIFASCTPGSFTLQDKEFKNGYKIIEKKDNNCLIEIEFIGPKTTEDPLQGYKMSCLLPLENSTKPYQIAKDLLSSKLNNCTGELKDRMLMPIDQLYPELSTDRSSITPEQKAAADKMIADAIAREKSLTPEQKAYEIDRSMGKINIVLSFCNKGYFYINLDNGAEMKFTSFHKYPDNCGVNVEYTKNQNAKLIGPKMSCFFPNNINSLPEVQKLINNKFIITDSNATSHICSGDLSNLIEFGSIHP